MAKNIHRSNRNANSSQMASFVVWAKVNPEEAWKQAVEEKETKPWKMAALRSREGEAAAAAIRATYLIPLIEAQAKLASFPKPSPASKAAQADLREARQRYSQIETALRPRPRPRRR